MEPATETTVYQTRSVLNWTIGVLLCFATPIAVTWTKGEVNRLERKLDAFLGQSTTVDRVGLSATCCGSCCERKATK